MIVHGRILASMGAAVKLVFVDFTHNCRRGSRRGVSAYSSGAGTPPGMGLPVVKTSGVDLGLCLLGEPSCGVSYPEPLIFCNFCFHTLFLSF